MGNYYFKDKIVEEMKKKIIDRNSPILNEGDLDEVGVVHIGQSSTGWVGMLEAQPKLYSTVSEMKVFYEKHVDRLIIVDENDLLLTWEQLENLLLYREGKPRGVKDEDGFYWHEGRFI